MRPSAKPAPGAVPETEASELRAADRRPVSASRPRRALRWTLANAAFQIGSKLATLAILSRVLAPSEFGLYYMGMAVVLVVGTVAQLGIPTNVVYVTQLRRATVAAALWLGLGSATATALLVWLGYALFLGQDGGAIDTTVLAAALYLPVQVAISILEAVARRNFEFKLLAFAELWATLIGSLAVSFVLAVMGWGFLALFAGQAVYGVLKIGMLARANRALLSARAEASEFRLVSHSSLSITVAEVANIAAIYCQRPIVGFALGPAAAGVWSRFYQVIAIQLGALIEPVDKLVLPSLARQRTDRDRVERNVLALIEVVSLASLPIALVTAAIAPIAVPLAFGPRWDGLIVPLQIGAVTLFFRGVDRILLSTSRSVGQMVPRACAQVVQLAVVLGGLLLTLPYGLNAIAAGFVATQALSLGMMICVVGWASGIRVIRILRAMLPGFCVAFGGLAAGLLAHVTGGTANNAVPLGVGLVVMLAIGLGLLRYRREILTGPLVEIIDGVLEAISGRRMSSRSSGRPQHD